MKKSDLQKVVKLIRNSMDQMEQVIQLVEGTVSDAEKEAIEKAKKRICTYCGERLLKNERAFRGAHQKCYKRINRAINSGEISDTQAVGRGWILPSDKGGRQLDPNDPLAKLREEKQSH